jgi:glycogen(starch) synthase
MNSNRKHILLVSYEFPPEMATGGIGSYMFHLSGLLTDAGFKVTVMSGTNSRDDVTKVELSRCENILIPASTDLIFRSKVLQVFEHYFGDQLPDLIESPEVGACAIEIKRKYPKVPLLVKLHSPGVLITKISNSYQPLIQKMRFVAGALRRGRMDLGYWAHTDKNKLSDPEYQICLLADWLYSPSVALKKWVSRYWAIPQNNIKVLPNPFLIDATLYKYDSNRNTRTICFVGKLTVLKGMYAFTHAIKKILLLHSDYKVIIAGRDELIPDKKQSMRSWMEEQLSAVSDEVLFTGALDRTAVNELMGKSEICIVPSLWENYPNVVLEAMAAGCAVIASDRGGIPELINDKENGLLIDALDENSIKNAIEKLINEYENRICLAAAGRSKVKTLADCSGPQIILEYNYLLNNINGLIFKTDESRPF